MQDRTTPPTHTHTSCTQNKRTFLEGDWASPSKRSDCPVSRAVAAQCTAGVVSAGEEMGNRRFVLPKASEDRWEGSAHTIAPEWRKEETENLGDLPIVFEGQNHRNQSVVS